MAGNRFDSSYDPAFDLRAAEISQAATVQQQARDDREAAREEHRDDHDRAAHEDREAADREAAREEHRDDHDRAAHEDRPPLTMKGDVQDADLERHGSLGDPRYQDIADLDSHVTVGADTSLHLDPGMVGGGAAGGNAMVAPDGVMETMAGLSPEVAIGADPTGGGVAGALDGVFEPVTESSPHVTIGADLTFGPDDPAFDLRVAAMAQAEAADAADGSTTRASTEESKPGGEDPGAIEHTGDDLLSATEDGLLAVAAPALAPVVAVVAAGEAVLDAGKAAYDVASDATDEIGDFFGGGDEHPGQSTFPDDPNAPKYTPEEYAAQREAALAARQAEVDEAERLRAIHDGAKAGNVEDAPVDHFSVFHDEHHELVGDLDDQVAAGAMTGSGLIDVQADLAGTGASGALGAPDNVMVPVDELRDHVGIGADPSLDLPPGLAGPGAAADPVVMDAHADTSVKLDPGMVGPGAAGGNAMDAPDGALETVAGLSPEVAIGADPVIDVDQLPTADHAPADVAFGADVQLNPQPIPPGMDLHPPASIDAGFGADVQLNPQPIPPGIGADIGEPAAGVVVDHAPSGDDSSIIIVGGEEAPLLADHAPADAALGADVQLNPQPIPPGMDLHPPSPIMGADIGEPAADVAVDQAPSGDDSSIIIVGGDESPMLSDDLDTSFAGAEDIAVDAAPMEQDIASTLAADTDGPAFQAVDIDEAPIDVGITENDFDS